MPKKMVEDRPLQCLPRGPSTGNTVFERQSWTGQAQGDAWTFCYRVSVHLNWMLVIEYADYTAENMGFSTDLGSEAKT